MNYLRLEIWGIIFNGLLAIVLLYYAYYIHRIFYLHSEKPKMDKHNSYFAAASLVIVALLLILGVIIPNRFDPLFAYPLNYYAVAFAGLWFVVDLIAHYILKSYYQFRKIDTGTIFNPLQNEELYSKRVSAFGHELKISFNELRRKGAHAVAVIFLFTFAVSPFVFFFAYNYVYLPSADQYSADTLSNVKLLSNINGYENAVYAAFPVLLLVEIGAFLAQINTEFLFIRYPDQPYLFHRAFLRTRRSDEQGSIGTHVYMTLGFLIGTIVLIYNQSADQTPFLINATFAIFLSTTFADLSAALIGMQFGERTWGKSKKTYLGTAVGMVVTYLATVWFVGPMLAIVSTIVFLITDVFLARAKLCDNFWFPVLLALIYRLFWPLFAPIFIVF